MRSSPGFAMRAWTCPWKYSVSSFNVCIATAGLVGPTSRMRWIQSRNRSPSDSGSPSMCAITRTGMCCEYCTAMSHSFASPMASSSSRHTLRARGSSLATACGVNAGSSTLRAGVCSGGSEVIGGLATISTFCSRTMTRREEKCSLS